MTKIAIVFAGQGAQYSGMGKDLYEVSSAARAVFDEAGKNIKSLCFSGTEEQLAQTINTQPCVFTADIACYVALIEKMEDRGQYFKESIEAMAGFSLGEFAAFTASGIISGVKEGLSLVKNRAELMTEAGKWEDGSPRGGMLAALGRVDDIADLVEKSRGEDVLEMVNFNSDMQTVIAGDIDALDRFSEAVANKGTKLKRAIKLNVSTAFHSPIMNSAAKGLEAYAENKNFNPPNCDVYLNPTAKKVNVSNFSQELVKENIVCQVKSPVLWDKTIKNMISDGIDVFIECGPGSTLSGLIKKIDRSIRVFNVSDEESLDETMAGLLV
jgi:[acyl-carrier-protein] S-malonyltransferase